MEKCKHDEAVANEAGFEIQAGTPLLTVHLQFIITKFNLGALSKIVHSLISR